MRNGSVKLVRLDVVVLKSRDVSSFFWIAFDPPVLPNLQPALPEHSRTRRLLTSRLTSPAMAEVSEGSRKHHCRYFEAGDPAEDPRSLAASACCDKEKLGTRDEQQEQGAQMGISAGPVEQASVYSYGPT